MDRILIINTAFVGDMILLTPLIRETKKSFPDALIDIVVVPSVANVFKHNPYLNEIIVFNKKHRKLASFIRTVMKLRANRYRLSLQPHSSLTTALISLFAGIPKRIGFEDGYFLTDRTPFRRNGLRLEKNLDLLRVLIKKDLDNSTEIFIADDSGKETEKYFAGLEGKKIAVSPGSIWFTKRWPEEYYKKLCLMLVDNGFAVVLTGSPDEQELCERVAPHKNSIVVAGKLTLNETAAIVKQCDLAICNDSGALHIANAVGTDVIAFFGPTVQSHGYFPYRKNDIVLEVELVCRPCGPHGNNKCPEDHHNCMKNISPEMAFEQVMKKFKGNSTRLTG